VRKPFEFCRKFSDLFHYQDTKIYQTPDQESPIRPVPYSGLGLDVSRVAAGIIAGMGIFSGGIVFIGKRGNVSGLTTAAGIWAMIGIGMVIGAGMYAVGIGSVIFVELVQFILHRELSIYKHEVVASITVKLPDADSSYDSFANKMSDYGTKLYSMRWERNSEGTFTIVSAKYFGGSAPHIN